MLNQNLYDFTEKSDLFHKANLLVLIVVRRPWVNAGKVALKSLSGIRKIYVDIFCNVRELRERG